MTVLNLSKISKEALTGKILRIILKIIPNNALVFILQGPLKGRRWIKGSGVNGYWLGSYEKEQASIFEKIVKKGDVVFDIGANVGFYSLLAAELVGNDGKVFSFEPLPGNVKLLKRHIEINNYKNIFVFDCAVYNKSGYSFLKVGVGSFQSYLKDSGELKVKVVSLDDLVFDKKNPLPDLMKIDIEGAEFEVLVGAENLIKEKMPTIFLSVHTDTISKKCINFLTGIGYHLRIIGKGDLIIAKK